MNIAALVEKRLYEETKYSTIVAKIMKAISGQAHDVKNNDILRLLQFGPTPSASDKATNKLIKDRTGIDLIDPDEGLDVLLKKIGLTPTEVDDTIEGNLW